MENRPLETPSSLERSEKLLVPLGGAVGSEAGKAGGADGGGGGGRRAAGGEVRGGVGR